jgi:hypothetical protein
MKWLVFSYSLPTKGGSSSRVTLWRRLRHLGALERTGLYVLPENAETIEAFTWLSQEVDAAGGQSTIMHVEKFSGLKDRAMIETFNAERANDYQTLVEEVNLYQKISSQLELFERTKALLKLRRQFDDITRIDFFNSRLKGQVAKILTKLEQSLNAPNPVLQIKLLKSEDYQNKIWVTRPQPYVDRSVSIWLIRRFVDDKAIIRYRDKFKVGEVSFDMPKADFGHHGKLCTFETLLAAFGLKEAVLQKMADIVHELDLQDGYYTQSESYGIEAILKGWQNLKLSDKELETRGITLFEGLYQSLKEKV